MGNYNSSNTLCNRKMGVCSMIAKCKICNECFCGVSTNGIHSHLINKHKKKHEELDEFMEVLCD